MTAGLKAIGFATLPIECSYFLCVDIRPIGFTGNDVEFCQTMTCDADVAAIPMSAFYQQGDIRHFARFFFQNETACLMQRYKSGTTFWLNAQRGNSATSLEIIFWDILRTLVKINLSREIKLNVLIDICVVPMGVGVSVSRYVAECEKIFAAAGLKHQMHAYGTNVEGEWDEVMAAVKKCHEVVHEMGIPRIGTTIRLGTRTDREQSMQDKIDSVEQKLTAAQTS